MLLATLKPLNRAGRRQKTPVFEQKIVLLVLMMLKNLNKINQASLALLFYIKLVTKYIYIIYIGIRAYVCCVCVVVKVFLKNYDANDAGRKSQLIQADTQHHKASLAASLFFVLRPVYTISTTYEA